MATHEEHVLELVVFGLKDGVTREELLATSAGRARDGAAPG